MRSLYALAGLLLCSAPAFSQTSPSSASADHKAQAPVTALPGEERLSVRERAERDFLMPVRHKQDAALRAAHEEAVQQATADASFIGPKEPEPEAAAAPAEKVAVPHRYHRRRPVHHRSSATTHKRKTTSQSGAAKKKVVTKKRRR